MHSCNNIYGPLSYYVEKKSFEFLKNFKVFLLLDSREYLWIYNKMKQIGLTINAFWFYFIENFTISKDVEIE